MQTGLDKARSWLREAIGAARPELRLEADSSGPMGVSVKFPTVRTDKDLSRLAAEVFALPQRLQRAAEAESRHRARRVPGDPTASTAAAWNTRSAPPCSISATSDMSSPAPSRA